ncbi:hypothetical protein OC844_007097, partial [Tilletia horrida]
MGRKAASQFSDSDKDDWEIPYEHLELSEEYPFFPDGNVTLKFRLSKCIDFGHGNDWVWRNKGRQAESHETLGNGFTQRSVCLGVLQCESCSTTYRGPASENEKRAQKWITKGCAVCRKRSGQAEGAVQAQQQVISSGAADGLIGMSGEGSGEEAGGKEREDISGGDSAQQEADIGTNVQKGLSTLKHIPCGARLLLTRFAEKDVGIMRHVGNHTHDHPDVRKPRPSALLDLRNVVIAHPHAKARGLSMGL